MSLIDNRKPTRNQVSAILLSLQDLPEIYMDFIEYGFS